MFQTSSENRGSDSPKYWDIQTSIVSVLLPLYEYLETDMAAKHKTKIAPAMLPTLTIIRRIFFCKVWRNIRNNVVSSNAVPTNPPRLPERSLNITNTIIGKRSPHAKFFLFLES